MKTLRSLARATLPALLPLVALSPLTLSGCMLGPDYRRPKVETPARFKEARPLPGWQVASPANATMPKGAWWTVYGDPILDDLEQELLRANQTLKAAVANYDQSVALVDEARGQLFPVLGLSPSAQRSGSNGRNLTVGTGVSSVGGAGSGTTGLGGATGSAGTTTGFNTGGTQSTLTFEGNISWDLDLWGRIRRQVEGQVASAQASAAEVANSRLSLEANLATYYFELRSSDSLQKLLDRTVVAYQRNADILHNQLVAGTAQPSDYLQALTTLRQTEASAAQVGIARAEYEHAIAVLTGHAPADLALAPGDLQSYVPEVPPGLPSELLQRRPDIAEEERAVEEANAQIGVAIAAFFPDISLSASGGFSGDQLSTLFNVANRFWSLGVAASETLFEGGIRSAEVRAAEAQYDSAVATYRGTVLSAFQGVEDQLSALRFLNEQAYSERLAVEAANQTVTVSLNEYYAGTQAYTTVVTSEATALADAQTALSVQQNRLTASVALIEALGGSWTNSQLPSKDQLQTNEPFLPAFIHPDTVPPPT